MVLRNLKLRWICAAVLAASVAQADDAATQDFGALSLEQLMQMDVNLVYGASRYEQRLTEAPAAISIVSADEIRRFGYATFGDVLRSVRGMYVTNDRNYSYIGMRGFLRPGDYSTRVLILVDGHRLNDNLYDSGSIGREIMIDVDWIERVEVIRGPSSSVYGSSAFLGVINVVTKQGAGVDGAQMSAEADDVGGYTARATYGTSRDNGMNWFVAASHYESSGADRLYYPEFDERISDNPRARNQGLATDLDDERASKFFTKLSYGGFTASAYYTDRTKQVPTASYDAMFADPGLETIDERGYLELAYTHAITDAWSVNARAFYDHYEYLGTLPYDYAEEGDPEYRVLFHDVALGEWFGGEVLLNAKLAERHTLSFGGEYRFNAHEDQTSYEDFEPRLYYLDAKGESSVLGVFAQLESRLRDDLSVTAGLRYDHYSDSFGGTLNPRVSVIYQPTQASAIKALYGEAFRAPNPYERAYYETQVQMPTLEPETIRTYELVYEHYLSSRYRVNVSAYAYHIEDLITLAEVPNSDGEHLYYYANIDAVRARGLEAELEAKYDSGAQWRVSFAEQRAEDAASDLVLTSSPHHLAKFAVSAPVYARQVYANLELQYQSESLTLERTHTADVWLTNLSLNTHDLWKGVELSFGVFNLFDSGNEFAGSEEHDQFVLEQDGRSFRGKVLVRF